MLVPPDLLNFAVFGCGKGRAQVGGGKASGILSVVLPNILSRAARYRWNRGRCTGVGLVLSLLQGSAFRRREKICPLRMGAAARDTFAGALEHLRRRGDLEALCQVWLRKYQFKRTFGPSAAPCQLRSAISASAWRARLGFLLQVLSS